LIAGALTQTNFADQGLTAGTKYFYALVAADKAGKSVYSATTSAATPPAPGPQSCHIAYTVTGQWPGGFQGAITITNTGSTALTSWSLKWAYANGQEITGAWNTAESQSGAVVTMDNVAYNGAIAAGGTVTGIGFEADDSGVNGAPAGFTLNGTVCK
jgi:hypothetical protein